MNKMLDSVMDEVVNVAKVPQRSPFRYPGGKTWLIPTFRKWISQDNKPAQILYEPFAGGGIISLTAAFEKMADSIIMVEIDEEIAAVWDTIINSNEGIYLANKILNFNLLAENIQSEFCKSNKSKLDKAFCTILKNRTYHGGIITKGSGLLKYGENGKGIASRWYPQTLFKRITDIELIRDKIHFIMGDGFSFIENNLNNDEAYFFIDPPYTVAGKRLYTYSNIDHERLFYLTSRLRGRYMLTYDDSSEIRNLAEKYQLDYRTIPMKTTHHLEKREIIISDNFNWL
jgi:DNA adenine methylase